MYAIQNFELFCMYYFFVYSFLNVKMIIFFKNKHLFQFVYTVELVGS